MTSVGIDCSPAMKIIMWKPKYFQVMTSMMAGMTQSLSPSTKGISTPMPSPMAGSSP
ncbi:hypothetical protein D3C86_2090800 [compost metagenome]